MNVLEVIDKKRLGKELSNEEIEFTFQNYMKGDIEDYQMSSLLMAIVINGMTLNETISLTDVMLKSGQQLDTSKIDGICVDKHSTGGIGDKTSLIIGPILASLGLKMGKLSGRGLGITGGTIDKLESIPGFRVSLTTEEFIHNLNKVGFTECEQTPEFTPLDKKIYELRSATGTSYSIPLIASSIMSKKLATNANYILIDIKVGSGALIKNKKDAKKLAGIMIEIGKKYQKTVIPVLTDMSKPLGDNIGNALEIIEVLDILKGKSGTLRNLCIELASHLYSKAKRIDCDTASKNVTATLDDGRAYNKFLEFVNMQGGDIEKLETSPNMVPVKALTSGTLTDIDAEIIGKTVLELGGGRHKKSDKIRPGVGIVINKHLQDKIVEGDILCYLYQEDEKDYTNYVLPAFTIVK